MPAVRWAVAGTSGLALVTGLLMFLAPARAVEWWPWPLTPLTARVVAATLCLGAAGLVVIVDGRWEAVRLLHQVQLVMFALILIDLALIGWILWWGWYCIPRWRQRRPRSDSRTI